MNATGRNWRVYLLAGFLLCVLGMAALIIFPSLPDPTCLSLIVRSEQDALILLPANCSRNRSMDSDSMVKYLEDERNRRGLLFRQWIICNGTPESSFGFMNDPRWLPSYVPGTYQYRRTVIIVPYAQPIPEGSPVIAEVCLMPWRNYIRQIAGECTGKYSVWK